MMNISKVLEILNNGEYEKIEEVRCYSSKYCPYSESSYKVTLKEGGMIKITQVISFGVFYRISLFVPNEDKSIKSWAFEKRRKGWLHRETVTDPLFDDVHSIFKNMQCGYIRKKANEHSKYFPQ